MMIPTLQEIFFRYIQQQIDKSRRDSSNLSNQVRTLEISIDAVGPQIRRKIRERLVKIAALAKAADEMLERFESSSKE